MTCSVGAQQKVLERPTSTLVWQGGKVDIRGSVSPDGRYISFTDPDTGDLSLHDFITNQNRTIAAAIHAKGGGATAFAGSSSISRDGNQVAYSWYDDSKERFELWIVNLHGRGAPRRLYGAENVKWLAPCDWSPDGSRIAVWLSLNGFGLGPDMGDSTQQLALISSDAGKSQVLKSGQWRGNTRAFLSPDGKYLAYDLPEDSARARDVWVTAIDGTMDSRIVAHRANDLAMGWSPDGKHLLFASDRSGSMTLFGLEMRSGTAQGAPVALKPDMGLSQCLGITPAGVLFYGTEGGRLGGSIRAAEFDLQLGAITSSRDVSSNPQETNHNPSFSRNGKYLAYLSERGLPGNTSIIVVRPANTGGVVREIDPKIQGAILAGWQPDGKSLLVTGRYSGKYGAFRVDLETGEVALLFASPWANDLRMPTWSADGGSLYYWNRVNDGSEQVFVARDIASGAEKQIIKRPLLGALMLSPDGHFLATETVDTIRNERVLLLVPLDGGAPREVMRVPSGLPSKDVKFLGKGAEVTPAAWVPDSQSLIARLQSEPEGPSELWQIPVDGRAPRKLPSSLEPYVHAFRIHPDGRRIAYRVIEPQPTFARQVWKFENFLPKKNNER